MKPMKSAKTSKSSKSYSALLESICLLTEGKIDDLKVQNPGLHHEIDQYTAADTSATKKFVPWLVSQHKKGNITPDHPDLHQTIQNFDRYKNLHGIGDHSNRSFQAVRDAVVPLVGKGATKREVAEEGREKIHDSNGIQAYHIKNKMGSQHFYGGGPDAGPTGTSWCVSARSPRCMFGHYGEMYTIHAKGDPDSPYAVHPEKNTITTRHNDGDRGIDGQLLMNPKVAALKPAIDAIRKHHDPQGFRLSTASDISDSEIDHTMNNQNSSHLDQLFKNPHEHVLVSVLKHPKATDDNLAWGVQHHLPAIALAALSNTNISGDRVSDAAMHKSPKVAMAALNHPKADRYTVWHAVTHEDPNVALAALNHPKADHFIYYDGKSHLDPRVRERANELYRNPNKK